MEYNAVYKCRLCGETYNGETTGNESIALMAVSTINIKGHFFPKCCAIGSHLTNTHCCKDGSFGLSDFQGFKKAE